MGKPPKENSQERLQMRLLFSPSRAASKGVNPDVMANMETGKLQMTTVNSIWHKNASSFSENRWVLWSIWDVALFSHIILSQFYVEEDLSNMMQSSELSNRKQNPEDRRSPTALYCLQETSASIVLASLFPGAALHSCTHSSPNKGDNAVL